MPRHRQEVARQVAEKLFAAERAIDSALAEAAALTGLMPAARGDARLSAIVGQDALERACETVSSLVQARHHIVATHNALSAVQSQIGLATVNFGGLVDKPPPSAMRPTLVPIERMAS